MLKYLTFLLLREKRATEVSSLQKKGTSMHRERLIKRFQRSAVSLGAVLAVTALFAASRAAETPFRVPVLLELFTSEGCSSCPPADRLLQELDEKQPVAGAELIVLSEHVDYWNRLGWNDPFSSAQYSERQQTYSEKYGFDGVYTPQLAVDGRWGLIGSDLRAATSAIQKAVREPKAALQIKNIERAGNKLRATVDATGSSAQSGLLYVAVAENHVFSHVGRGETSGRVLSHVAVTRVFQEEGKLGAVASKKITLAQPQGVGLSGLKIVAFVQDPKSGHVLGAAQHKL